MVPGHPIRLASANPSTASTCTWRHFDTTPPEEPYSAHDIPWLHTIHRLLLCLAFRPGRFPVPQFCSEMLPLAWTRLSIIAALLPIYGTSPQFQPSPCAPFTHLYTGFLCLLTYPMALRTQLWVSLSPHGLAAGKMLPPSRPVSYAAPLFLSGPLLICLSRPYSFGLHYYHGQSGWRTCLCLLCHRGFFL
jgi:hypothetical protein